MWWFRRDSARFFLVSLPMRNHGPCIGTWRCTSLLGLIDTPLSWYGHHISATTKGCKALPTWKENNVWVYKMYQQGYIDMRNGGSWMCECYHKRLFWWFFYHSICVGTVATNISKVLLCWLLRENHHPINHPKVCVELRCKFYVFNENTHIGWKMQAFDEMYVLNELAEM